MDVPILFRSFKVVPRGVIHVGAHDAVEYAAYKQWGFLRQLFIEADPALAEKIQCRGLPGVTVIAAAVSDIAGQGTLHVMSYTQSSSLLPLKQHAVIHPDIVEVGQIPVQMRTLDAIMRDIPRPHEFNYLVLDVQGVEDRVLRGATQTLRHIQAIMCELNFVEMYAGCAVTNRDPPDKAGRSGIDALLPQFERIQTDTSAHLEYGDAFYTRREGCC